jgi:hypothetical protein
VFAANLHGCCREAELIAQLSEGTAQEVEMNKEVLRRYGLAVAVGLAVSFMGAAPSAAQRAVLKEPLTIYQQPDLTSGVVARVEVGDTILVVARDGAWVEVKVASGRYGWFRIGQERRKERSSATNGEKRPAPERRHSSTSARSAAAGPPPSRVRSRDVALRQFARPRNTGFSFGIGTFEGDAAYLFRLAHQRISQLSWEATLGHVVNPEASLFLLYAGVVYQPISWGPIQPFLAVGFGVVNTVPKQIETAKSISQTAANYGFGVQWPLGGRVALKAEFRQYAVFVNGSNVNRQGFTLGIALGRFRQ